MLALLRHAKAAAALRGQQDIDRPLTERGRDDADRIGRVLGGFPIDEAIVSAARRTRETWDIAATRLQRQPAVSIEPALYLCGPGHLIERIRAIGDGCRGAVLIGHNPCWHEVALWLAGGSDPAPLQAGFPTAALAIFTFAATTPWSALEPARLKLERFVTAHSPR
jgi:phosphohistidine phosphatase